MFAIGDTVYGVDNTVGDRVLGTIIEIRDVIGYTGRVTGQVAKLATNQRYSTDGQRMALCMVHSLWN